MKSSRVRALFIFLPCHLDLIWMSGELEVLSQPWVSGVGVGAPGRAMRCVRDTESFHFDSLMPGTGFWGRQESDFIPIELGCASHLLATVYNKGAGLPFVISWTQSSLPRGLVPKAFKGTSTGCGNLGQDNSQGEQQTYQETGEGRGWEADVCGDKSF